MTVDQCADREYASSHAPVYLDANATTPVDPRIAAEVLQYMAQEFGNAGSRTHSYGQAAKERVARARRDVAAAVSAKPDEVIFTSGATESNNLAILGLAEAGEKLGKRHVISTMIEHKAVLEPLAVLEQRGFEVTLVPPTRGGWVDPEDIRAAVRPDTVLVSVMAANNETGVVQPLVEVAECALAGSDAFFHVDAAQTFGKLFEPLRHQRIDLMSISGHKVFAPKGIGALVMRRRGFNRPPLTPLMHGGGQERGLRPGTLPVALIAGLGLATTLALAEGESRSAHNAGIRQAALDALESLDIHINGDSDRSLSTTINFSVAGIDSEAAIVALKDIVAISNGSACTAQSYDRSHVLLAAGLSDSQIDGALRFSWSHLTNDVPWRGVAERLNQLRQ